MSPLNRQLAESFLHVDVHFLLSTKHTSSHYFKNLIREYNSQRRGLRIAFQPEFGVHVFY